MSSPSPPFSPSHCVTLNIDFDDRNDDRRRIEGEWWCLANAQGRWFRRSLTRNDVVEFHFEDRNEATMFWLAH